ncbi:MAG: PAS domain-containing protein [Deltaproteobacteria bacterium]|nr:PAS domain-containing protein [Deltaproteobacteria bacterium]MBW2012547.1 PAS domain-containing protein [Deltaproteobacteria bacterium]MBW2089582.1 PAS domain-containing protein [Deltaproteobacteria bacterium]MBW2320232.1 PAS domain-containing protein [Deltaproteobacteria bacterium]OQY01024.1 MAG: PAS domain-containing sensor histidine kinase [Desulfobacteraceae bacterium 4572_123]
MKLGLRSKIYFGMFSLLLLLGIVILFVVSGVMTESLLEENRNRGISIGVNLSARITEPILAMDFLRMKTLVDKTAQLNDDIFYTFVLDAGGKPLVHTFKGGFPVDLKTANIVSDHQKFSMRLLDTGEQLIYDYAVPVFIGEDRLGTVRLGLLRIRIQKAINRIMLSAFLSTIFVILIAGFVGAFLARPVTRRIKILHESSEQALRGNLDIHTAPLLKKNCWDIMNCNKQECPAYGNLHHRCWYIAGTLCPTCVEGEYAKKITSCQKCPVYRKCSGDEIQSFAESFDTMTQSLKAHLSDLQHAEKTLKAQRELLQTILDGIPDFISLQDRKTVYKSINNAFCKIVGKKKDEIVGKTDFDLFPWKQAQIYHQENLAIFDTGKPLIKEDKISSPKGEKWLHMVKIPVFEADGNVAGLLCSGRDITELKRVQEHLTQAQKMESVGQLAAGIAHEINTPLGIILGYAQLLLEDVDEDGQIYADIKTIEKQTKICRKIVADLLRFSRRMESIVTSLDINQSIEEVVAVVEHTFKLERVIIERNYGSSLPSIMGDKDKLKQVFVNLLNNAHDAIENDGVITITTRFNEDNNELIISVADTGIGISSENVEKIFDPFFTTKGVGKGTGLGLSVTFGIIKEHGGTIEVQSPPGFAKKKNSEDKPGAVFIIHLPVSGHMQ